MVWGGSEKFYTQAIVVIADHAPLLAIPRLARLVYDVLKALAPGAPGNLWGMTVLPDSVRLVVGPAPEDAVFAYVDTLKAQSQARLLNTIRHMSGCETPDAVDPLDRVLRYNPVWGGMILRVWQNGWHRQVFRSEYKLSNALYELRQAPVEAGLVASADHWPYTWLADA
ncbi:MAG: hypothetical protein JW966_07950 [Anaerolineae bacterium]|nr:hypothetical protein [Anaerolineae bacterium]